MTPVDPSSPWHGLQTRVEMTNQDAEVRRFIAKLGLINDTRSLATAFESLISLFHCKFFVISGIPDELASLQEMLITHNLPKAWVAEYLANNYVSHDPVVRHCMEEKNPFYWKDVNLKDSGLAKNIMTRAESYGLINGVCFPIHNINGFEAGVSISGSSTALKATEIRALYLASITSFNALRRIRSDHSLRIETISERESEILTWCALGKTAKEIAYILFVSENTVNVHIKHAIKKLSAKNKTEAVAIAARKGTIVI
jgi:LuxR family quorum sensing-dependent transcriptional regulator